MKHHTEYLVRGPGQQMFWQSWKPARKQAKAVIVIIHGFGEHSGRYKNVVASLLPAGFAVYAADNRGHGKSFGPRGHVDSWGQFRGDLHAFLTLVREREPGLPLFLFGHSMGGLITLDYVIRHPGGLAGVAVSGPALEQGAVSPFLILAAKALSAVWPTFSMETGLEAEAISRDARVVAEYKADPLVHSTASARFGTEMGAAAKWVKKHAPEFCPPLFMIHGAADRLVAPESGHEFYHSVAITDKQRIEYPGYFHETHNDVGWENPVGDLVEWFQEHL